VEDMMDLLKSEKRIESLSTKLRDIEKSDDYRYGYSGAVAEAVELRKKLKELRETYVKLSNGEKTQKKFCTCTKPARKLYTNICLNCGLSVTNRANVNSNQADVSFEQFEVTIIMHGTPVHFRGNAAYILDAIGSSIPKIKGCCAADTINRVSDWFDQQPKPSNLKAAKDEIMGILKRRRVFAGKEAWSLGLHVFMDYEARKNDKNIFQKALDELLAEGLIELSRGTESVRIKQAD
jgi:hypothetical protein